MTQKNQTSFMNDPLLYTNLLLTKVIIEKFRGKVSLVEQDTIENNSLPI